MQRGHFQALVIHRVLQRAITPIVHDNDDDKGRSTMAPRRRKAWVWPNEDNDDEVSASDSRELTPTNDGSGLCHAGAPLQRIVVNVEPRAVSGKFWMQASQS